MTAHYLKFSKTEDGASLMASFISALTRESLAFDVVDHGDYWEVTF